MDVYLNKISGYASAMDTMYQSKRSWTRELERYLYRIEKVATQWDGSLINKSANFDDWKDCEHTRYHKDFHTNLQKLCNIGKKHITLLRFIDLEFTVDGIHRGAQDDFDAHAKRLDNRIVRASTRLSEFGSETSSWYSGKIIPFDRVLAYLEVDVPDTFNLYGVNFVRTTNGYIREDLKDDMDVKRGLYMLSIPSTFTAKCNITEFAHIVKLRDKTSHAAPELREMIESLLAQIEDMCPYFTRELFYAIEN